MAKNFENTMTEADFKRPLLDAAEERLAASCRREADLRVDSLNGSLLGRLLNFFPRSARRARPEASARSSAFLPRESPRAHNEPDARAAAPPYGPRGSRAMWISKPIYEVLPFYYVALGLARAARAALRRLLVLAADLHGGRHRQLDRRALSVWLKRRDHRAARRAGQRSTARSLLASWLARPSRRSRRPTPSSSSSSSSRQSSSSSSSSSSST